MFQNKYLKFIIPIVAVVVIIEAIVLVDGLTKKVGNSPRQNMEMVSVSTDGAVKQSDRIKIALYGDNQEIKAVLEPISNVNLDAINLYIKFDPKKVTVKTLRFEDESLPKPTIQKISNEKGVVVIDYLISEKQGLVLEKGSNHQLVVMEIDPKVKGKIDFEITTGKETGDSATMFVETDSSKQVPFEVQNLSIEGLN